MEKFIESTIENMSKIEGNVLCGVSGGIDSTVAALLLHKAVGDRLKCVFVDNGLLRVNEEAEIEEMFKNNFKVNFTPIYAAEKFLEKLQGVSDPEQKRKIVGEEFIRIFTEFAEKKMVHSSGVHKGRYIRMLLKVGFQRDQQLLSKHIIM